MNYMPFNSVNHDRKYKAEDWAWYFSTFISNGVFPSPDNGLKVLASEAMTILVNAGYGFINGYAFRNQESFSLTIEDADGTLERIDRVVLRWSLTDRTMYLAILTGTPSASPAAKALTQGADVFEIALADISVSKGLTTVTQSNITDTRYDASLCGICAGIIDQIDFTEITAQFDKFFDEYQKKITKTYNDYTKQSDSYFDEFEKKVTKSYEDYTDSIEDYESLQKTSFNTWFNEIKDQLSEDAAGKLQNEVNTLAESAFKHYTSIENSTTTFASNGTITTVNDEATIVTSKSYDQSGRKVMTSVVTPKMGTTIYTETTTFCPATSTEDKKIVSTYSTN